MKSKDPAGACASCRKEIPLVPGDQGDLVLQEHHVVICTQGYDVEECPGSGAAPTSLDDDADWAWIPAPAPQTAEPGPVTLGEAIARMTGPIQAAGDAFRRVGEATPETFRLSTEQPTRVEVDGVDITDAITSVEINLEPPTGESELLAGILAAVQQAYIDETGVPPADAEASWDTVIDGGPRTLKLRLPVSSGQYILSIPFDPMAAADPHAREALARQAGDTVASRLRQRTCGAASGVHMCRTVGQHATHGCAFPLCDATWTDQEAPHGTE